MNGVNYVANKKGEKITKTESVSNSTQVAKHAPVTESSGREQPMHSKFMSLRNLGVRNFGENDNSISIDFPECKMRSSPYPG